MYNRIGCYLCIDAWAGCTGVVGRVPQAKCQKTALSDTNKQQQRLSMALREIMMEQNGIQGECFCLSRPCSMKKGAVKMVSFSQKSNRTEEEPDIAHTHNFSAAVAGACVPEKSMPRPCFTTKPLQVCGDFLRICFFLCGRPTRRRRDVARGHAWFVSGFLRPPLTYRQLRCVLASIRHNVGGRVFNLVLYYAIHELTAVSAKCVML